MTYRYQRCTSHSRWRLDFISSTTSTSSSSPWRSLPRSSAGLGAPARLHEGYPTYWGQKGTVATAEKSGMAERMAQVLAVSD